jgi:diguanylate cyclase (GGDEF)-like protein
MISTVDATWPRAASANPTGSLTPTPATKLVRWLIAPARPVSPAIAAALVKEIDITPGGMVATFASLLAMNGICFGVTRTPLFLVLFILNLAVGLLRVLLCKRLLAGDKRPVLTDIFILASLAWFAVVGLVSGAALFSGSAPLQVLSTAAALAMQGPLCARAYAAPRFATAIILAIDIPLLAACAIAPQHWLLGLLAFGPAYLFGSLSTIKRFQHVAIETQEGRLASQHQARHDPLTGALNRAGLLEVLNSGEQPDRLAFFHIDLDDFKTINDSFGHHAGDALLQQVTARLRAITPVAGAVARLGGDEFAVLIPGMTPAESEMFADGLVATISHEAYTIDAGIRTKIGLSVGFACVPDDCASLAELYRKADVALYAVKAQGKGNWRRAA